MFTGLRHNLVNAGTGLVTEFCNLFDMGNIFGAMANCSACIVACEGTRFNGVTDFGNHLTPSQSNSKVGTISVWFKLNGSDGVNFSIYITTGLRFRLVRNASNLLQILGKNAALTNILRMRATGTYTADSTWKHLIASWDLANTTGWMYIDGVDVLDAAQPPIFTNDTVVLNDVGLNLPQAALNGELTEFWFDSVWTPNTAANREKFRSAIGEPVSLGADGSTPFGSSPSEYYTGGDPEFFTNSGTGNDLTRQGSPSTVDGPGV